MLCRHRLNFSIAVTAAFVLAGPISLALADDGAPPTVPDDVAAAAQYRESVPTASGRVPSGTGNGSRATLPARVRNQISQRGGRDKALLTSVAGSPGAGAPDSNIRRSAGKSPGTNSPGGISAAWSTLTANGGLIPLMIVLAVVSLAVAVAGRLRSGSRGSGSA